MTWSTASPGWRGRRTRRPGSTRRSWSGSFRRWPPRAAQSGHGTRTANSSRNVSSIRPRLGRAKTSMKYRGMHELVERMVGVGRAAAYSDAAAAVAGRPNRKSHGRLAHSHSLASRSYTGGIDRVVPAVGRRPERRAGVSRIPRTRRRVRGRVPPQLPVAAVQADRARLVSLRPIRQAGPRRSGPAADGLHDRQRRAAVAGMRPREPHRAAGPPLSPHGGQRRRYTQSPGRIEPPHGETVPGRGQGRRTALVPVGGKRYSHRRWKNCSANTWTSPTRAPSASCRWCPKSQRPKRRSRFSRPRS